MEQLLTIFVCSFVSSFIVHFGYLCMKDAAEKEKKE